MKQEKIVYLILTGVVTIWGLNVVMVKYLSIFPPVLSAAFRMSIAALTLLPFAAVAVRKGSQRRLHWQDWLLIAGVSLCSIFLHQIFFAWGVQYTSAGNSSLILGLNPLVTTLLAALFLGEALTKQKLAGVVIGLAGVLLVVFSQANGSEVTLHGWGDFLVFMSMIAYVLGSLLIRMAAKRGIEVLLVTAYSHVIAALLLWVLALGLYPLEVFRSLDTRPFTWAVAVSSGMFATALGSLCWNHSIRLIGASKTSLFLNGIPLTSLLFAALLLGEPLRLLHVLALAMIVLGIYLGTHERRPQRLAGGRKEVQG